MHKNNNNNGHFSKVISFVIAAFVPLISIADELPPLPPLPPLPGMEAPAPKKVAESKAVPEVVAEKPNIEVPKMPALPSKDEVADDTMFDAPAAPVAGEDEFSIPDFGLFNPSDLPNTPKLSKADTDKQVPEVAEAPKVAEVPKNDDSEISDMLEAPDLPALPALPGFETPADIPPPVVASVKKETPKPVDVPKTPNLADLTPPELPKDKPMDNQLVDALPSWMTDKALPTLKPLPQDRDVAKKEDKPKAKPTQKAEAKPNVKDEDSLADLIDREINSGEVYEEDGGHTSIAGGLNGEEKRVVWPRNFKTQSLPPEIYKKQYSNANRHLPHAVYKKEIEAHMFGAVGANDADAVRALLRTGVPLNIKNTRGEDLVMHAVKAQATTTLQLLLALGANPSEQDRYGATPLHRAVFMGRQDMATILLRAGANSYINDMSGVTPMAIAVARRDQPMMQTLGYYQASGYSNQRHMARYQPY